MVPRRRSARGHPLYPKAPRRGPGQRPDFASLVVASGFYDPLPDDPQAALDVIYAKADECSYFRATGFAWDTNCHDPLEEDRAATAARSWPSRACRTSPTPSDEAQARLLLSRAEVPGVEDAGTVTDITGEEVLAVIRKRRSSTERATTLHPKARRSCR